MNRTEEPVSSNRQTETIPSADVSSRTSSLDSSNEVARLRPVTSNHLRPSVELHIDQLVLHGFEPAQRYTIADALERELTRLLTEHGAPVLITNDLDIGSLNGGVINLDEGSNAKDTGTKLARMIYGGLGR